jgi:hypothetical protein
MQAIRTKLDGRADARQTAFSRPQSKGDSSGTTAVEHRYDGLQPRVAEEIQVIVARYSKHPLQNHVLYLRFRSDVYRYFDF